jgi:hypothetical protein
MDEPGDQNEAESSQSDDPSTRILFRARRAGALGPCEYLWRERGLPGFGPQ